MLDKSCSRHGIPFGWHLPTQRMVQPDHVVNGRACECVCVACGGRLVARQGAIRVWHFAHGVDADCKHATEAAIHRMAKQLIVERGCLFVPAREMSRSIYGKRRVWEETLTVAVQLAGVQKLHGCELEKTIGTPKTEGEFYRPDVLGVLDGHPLAVEILNTHAVDHGKLQWLEQRQYSVVEIGVSDIAFLPPDQLQTALETRLFENADHSSWLTHAKDSGAQVALDELEPETRRVRFDEERRLLASTTVKQLSVLSIAFPISPERMVRFAEKSRCANVPPPLGKPP